MLVLVHLRVSLDQLCLNRFGQTILLDRFFSLTQFFEQRTQVVGI
jgi:hypothetical protein